MLTETLERTAKYGLILLAAVTMLSVVTGCSDKTAIVNFKINSEPEGAQVIYQAVGKDLPCGGEWIYLGNTPLRGVRHFSKKRMEKIDKITLKVMHHGHRSQQREWDGPSFWDEAEGRGVIFWTPEMIPNTGN